MHKTSDVKTFPKGSFGVWDASPASAAAYAVTARGAAQPAGKPSTTMTTDPDGKPYRHNEEQSEAAKRGRMVLPTTQPTHADIAWYAREVECLREMLIRADAALETLGVGKLAPVRVNIAHTLSSQNNVLASTELMNTRKP